MEAAGATCPPLTDTVGPLQMACDLTPNGAPHHFRRKTSCSMVLSKVRSTTIFFSLPFSYSSCFRRQSRSFPTTASSTALGLAYSDAICSSVNRFRFIASPSLGSECPKKLPSGWTSYREADEVEERTKPSRFLHFWNSTFGIMRRFG